MSTDRPRPPRPIYRLIRQQDQPTDWLGWHLDIPDGTDYWLTCGLPTVVWRERRFLWSK